jgi:molecular chaperone HscB
MPRAAVDAAPRSPSEKLLKVLTEIRTLNLEAGNPRFIFSSPKIMENKTTQTRPVSTEQTCWACHRSAGTGHLCQRCSALQPLPNPENHFTVMGLRPRLNLDPSHLQKKFYELSRNYHPDFYQTKTPKEKSISETVTAMINTAYETLNDPIKRIEYLLVLEGMPIEQGNSKPPMDLFEEILSVQEALSDLRESQLSKTSTANEAMAIILKAKEGLEARQTELRKRLEALSQRWDACLDSSPAGHGSKSEEKNEILTGLRETLGETAYLRTVLRDIQKTVETGS